MTINDLKACENYMRLGEIWGGRRGGGEERSVCVRREAVEVSVDKRTLY